MCIDNKIMLTRYGERELYTIMHKETHNGIYVGGVRGQFSDTESGFFQEISSAFRFPYYFGWNWAAFDDCMTDLEWLSFSGLLLVIDRAELLFQNEPDAKASIELLRKHLLAAISYWDRESVDFKVIFNATT